MMNQFASKTVLIQIVIKRTARRCLNANHIAQTAFPSHCIQGPGAISMFSLLVSKHFDDSSFVIVDPFVHDNIMPTVNNMGGDQLLTHIFGGDSSKEEIERLVDVAKSLASPEGCMIGVGGGKTMDVGVHSATAHLFVRLGMSPQFHSLFFSCLPRAMPFLFAVITTLQPKPSVHI